MSRDGAPGRWVVLLAVKPLPLAKSRLDRPDRSALTLAFAADTAAAAASVESVQAVLVITDDEDAERLLSPGCVIIADTPAAGLNAALSHGAAEAARRWPGSGVVVVAADLPALRPAVLAAALELAGRHHRTVVADAIGTGTVLLSAVDGMDLRPAFGPGSRGLHIAGGAVDITDGLAPGPATAGLRHDVDTAADLEVAIGVGVGPETTRVLEASDPFTNKWQTPRVSDSGVVTPGVRPRS
jgi:2-phospho-L-lactate/phosphoenolpyruvate guanylyltransferase